MAGLSAAAANSAAAGIQSDAVAGDEGAQNVVLNGDVEADAVPHAFANPGEGSYIGPNGAWDCDDGTGAYSDFSESLGRTMPYSNYMGSVQDGMDFNPVGFLQHVEWSGYLVISAVLVYGGAAWTSSGASALLVQDLSNHQ